MTEKQGNEFNEAKVPVSKLMIDKESDFRFHAAYLAYSQGWDKTALQETKERLNELILSVSKEEIDYESFYEKMNQSMGSDSGAPRYAYARDVIKTQGKKDWRRGEQRSGRNARHKGKR
jgi:hypothetical protein